jgi:hypothetical protein
MKWKYSLSLMVKCIGKGVRMHGANIYLAECELSVGICA